MSTVGHVQYLLLLRLPVLLVPVPLHVKVCKVTSLCSLCWSIR